MTVRRGFPLGASVTIDELDVDPHPLLAALRESEPVSWVPALDGWMVTSYDLALRVLRDTESFSVDDARFSTARVLGPSMLSLDGAEHGRHRDPFAEPFRPGQVNHRFPATIEQEAERLIGMLHDGGSAELRREFAGPLAAATITAALGLEPDDRSRVLEWYRAIVTAVNEITAGAQVPAAARRAFLELSSRLEAVLERDDHSSLLSRARGSGLDRDAIVSNAAVLLFGGIETTEAMICNAVLAVLGREDALAAVRANPRLLDGAIEESLRLEPAATMVDRYAQVDVELGGTPIGSGELVRVSIAAANRDPHVFPQPERFDLHRGVRRHLAFAQGPHVCLGVHLARLEARIALSSLLARLPRLRRDPAHSAAVRGLVFRKPQTLNVLWG